MFFLEIYEVFRTAILRNYTFFEGYHQRWRDCKLPRDYRSLTTASVEKTFNKQPSEGVP